MTPSPIKVGDRVFIGKGNAPWKVESIDEYSQTATVNSGSWGRPNRRYVKLERLTKDAS